MSLEKALEANTAAILAQTALMEKLAGAKGGAATTATTAKTDTKKDTPKAKTVEDLRAAASAYLGVTDEAERTARKAKVSKMLTHYGIAKVTDLGADKFDEAIGFFKALQAGETVPFLDDAEEDQI